MATALPTAPNAWSSSELFTGMPLYLPCSSGIVGESDQERLFLSPARYCNIMHEAMHSCHHDNNLQRTDITWTEMSTAGSGPWLVRVQCSYNQSYSSSECMWLQSSDGLPSTYPTLYNLHPLTGSIQMSRKLGLEEIKRLHGNT